MGRDKWWDREVVIERMEREGRETIREGERRRKGEGGRDKDGGKEGM